MLGPQISARRNVLGKSIFSSLSLLLFKEKDPNLFVSSQLLLSVLLVVVFFYPKRLIKLTSDTHIDTIIIKQSNGTQHTQTTLKTIVEVN